MVLTSLKTLVEYVHMAINADEHTWLIKLVLVFLILIPLMLISKRELETFSESASSQVNGCCIRRSPLSIEVDQ